MVLFPAVDIRGGQTVRLEQGDFSRETVYEGGPLAAALKWLGLGASHLHVVDLDGARSGKPVNIDLVSQIITLAKRHDAFVQVGGGLRTYEQIERILKMGADRCIIGTAAIADEGLIERACAAHGKEIAVSVDASDGVVRTDGWQKTGEVKDIDVIERLASYGLGTIVYSSIGRDGTLEGPDVEALVRVSQRIPSECKLIYAGGIGSVEHIKLIASHGPGKIEGVIVGKALYEGKVDVAEAILALSE